MSAATQALNVISEQGSAAADKAREKLRAVIKLVPEREEQTAIITNMVEKGMFSELRSTLVHLYDEDALGTSAVLAWAKYVKDVGYTKEIMKVLDGKWVSSHQVRSVVQFHASRGVHWFASPLYFTPSFRPHALNKYLQLLLFHS